MLKTIWFTKRPYELVGVVKKLRLQGIAIDLCKEERIKRADLLKKKETFACNSDIQKIVDYYSENQLILRDYARNYLKV